MEDKNNKQDKINKHFHKKCLNENCDSYLDKKFLLEKNNCLVILDKLKNYKSKLKFLYKRKFVDDNDIELLKSKIRYFNKILSDFESCINNNLAIAKLDKKDFIYDTLLDCDRRQIFLFLEKIGIKN